MKIELPKKPELNELELELTNYCNANCVACPRDKLTVKKGFMDDATFYAIIDQYCSYREQLTLNKITGKNQYPFVVFAGLGEPLLHKHIYAYIKYVRAHGFRAMLYTNGSLLDRESADKLVEAGINHINFGFWGIRENEYRDAMGLDYYRSLANVEYMSKIAAENEISLLIGWVKNKFITSSTKEVIDFWDARNVAVDTDEDNRAWNRGGHLSQEHFLEDFSSYPSVNFDMKVWCSQLYFTDTVAWNGDVVICSCDLYEKKNVIGNLLDISPNEIKNRKYEILSGKKKMEICQSCKKPVRNYSFGSDLWDQLLDQEERKKYDYNL
jgi:sulfatase maturation enzyme AslB (radical SAM superfamily)